MTIYELVMSVVAIATLIVTILANGNNRPPDKE